MCMAFREICIQYLHESPVNSNNQEHCMERQSFLICRLILDRKYCIIHCSYINVTRYPILLYFPYCPNLRAQQKQAKIFRENTISGRFINIIEGNMYGIFSTVAKAKRINDRRIDSILWLIIISSLTIFENYPLCLFHLEFDVDPWSLEKLYIYLSCSIKLENRDNFSWQLNIT